MRDGDMSVNFSTGTLEVFVADVLQSSSAKVPWPLCSDGAVDDPVLFHGSSKTNERLPGKPLEAHMDKSSLWQGPACFKCAEFFLRMTCLSCAARKLEKLRCAAKWAIAFCSCVCVCGNVCNAWIRLHEIDVAKLSVLPIAAGCL